MITVRGIDADNYDGAIPVTHYQKLHDVYGVRFQILGLEAAQPYAAAQRDNGLSAGVSAEFGYKFLYWQDDDLERMKQAASFGLPVAIDVEYGDGMPGGYEATVERILQAKDVLKAEGRYWGGYSSLYEWGRLTGGSMALAGDNGWAAGYPYGSGVVPPIDYLPDLAHFTGFGGLLIKVAQYADACYEDGPWHLDLNCMLKEDDMKDGWVKEGNQWKLYNDGVAVLVIGDAAGSFPGQIAKLFGSEYRWLKAADATVAGDAIAVISNVAGD